MNKWIYAAAALGVVTLGVVGGSALTGNAVTSRLSSQTTALGKLLPGLKVEEQIDRGVFNTTRTVTLRFGCAQLPGASGKPGGTTPAEIGWRDEIHHVLGGQSFGLALIDSRLILPASIAKEARELFGDKPPFAAHTRINFGGGFESNVVVPALKVKPRPSDELRFSGLTGRVTGQFPRAKGTLRFNWSEAPLSLQAVTPDANFKLEVGAVDATGSMEIDPDKLRFLMPLAFVASLDSMKLQVSGPNPSGGGAPVSFDIAFTKVKATAESKLDKELFTSSSDLSGALDVNGFAVEKFELGGALRRFHAPTYEKLLKEFTALSLSCDKPNQLDDPDAVFAKLAGTMFDMLPHDPEYAVGPVAIELGGKRAELSYSLGTRGITPNDKSVPLVMLLAQKGVARAEAKAHLGLIDELTKIANKALGSGNPAPPPGTPDPMAIMARAMIDEFVTQGYLVREGESVRGSVESVAGELKVNGKPFAMPDLGLRGP